MDAVKLEPSCVVNGRRWSLYGFEYRTPDGTFGGYLYALSDEHAADLLLSMRENATLTGRLIKHRET